MIKPSERSYVKESVNEPGAISKQKEVSLYLTTRRMNKVAYFLSKGTNNVAVGKSQQSMWKKKKSEPSYTASGTVKWYSCFGKESGSSSSKELPEDTAILLLGI